MQRGDERRVGLGHQFLAAVALYAIGGSAVATLDSGASLFFDHHDPEIVTWLAQRRVEA